nr:MAG TPA: hypothetical protein [Caudoviricetes sp.]
MIERKRGRVLCHSYRIEYRIYIIPKSSFVSRTMADDLSKIG